MAWYIHQDNGVGVLGWEVGVQGWGWDGGAGWPGEWQVLSLVHPEETLQPLNCRCPGLAGEPEEPAPLRPGDCMPQLDLSCLATSSSWVLSGWLAISLRPCDPVVVVVGGWCNSLRKKFILAQWLLVS